MADKYTFDEYINNPSGSRSHMVGEKEIAKSVYNDKYNKMILMCGGQINYVMWKSEPKRYVIYIQMPSETTPKLYYDVMVEFTGEDNLDYTMPKLDNYKVRFFSNDPNFTFTFAHAFYKKGMIIPELVKKISPKALKEPPTKTNPNILAGYVKSIYFAYIFMRNKGLFNKLNWLEANPIRQMPAWVKQYVMDSDKKYLYAQNFQKLKTQKGNVRVSSQDGARGLEKAAHYVDHQSSYIKRTNEVKKINRSHSTVKATKTTRIIGKKR
jgi:hypothetical protein